MKPLLAGEISHDLLEGKHVFAAGNRAAGCVTRVLGSGQTAIIHVDLGGLLCLYGRTIALPAAELTIGREDNGEIVLLSKLSLQDMNMLPEVKD